MWIKLEYLWSMERPIRDSKPCSQILVFNNKGKYLDSVCVGQVDSPGKTSYLPGGRYFRKGVLKEERTTPFSMAFNPNMSRKALSIEKDIISTTKLFSGVNLKCEEL
jgi:hypothetical protein